MFDINLFLIHILTNTNLIMKQQKHIIRIPVVDCCSFTFGLVVRNQYKLNVQWPFNIEIQMSLWLHIKYK